MSRTGTPYKRIFERVLECAMHLITNIFNTRVAADDKCLIEIGVNPLSIEIISKRTKKFWCRVEEKGRTFLYKSELIEALSISSQ